METVINFFALRPTFTVLGLKVVWYLYLANIVVQNYVAVSNVTQALAQRGVQINWWSSLGTSFLGVAAQVAIVRLLLEVAAIVISTSPTTTRRP
jgi:hypothetical protein